MHPGATPYSKRAGIRLIPLLVAVAAIGLSLPWIAFLYLRLDLLSVVLAVGGLALARRRALTAGGAMVGIACFAKIWPLALAPMFAARRTWRA